MISSKQMLHINQHFNNSTRIFLNKNNFHQICNFSLHPFSLIFDSLVSYLLQLFKVEGKKSHVCL